jgi:hypothetical protein
LLAAFAASASDCRVGVVHVCGHGMPATLFAVGCFAIFVFASPLLAFVFWSAGAFWICLSVCLSGFVAVAVAVLRFLCFWLSCAVFSISQKVKMDGR